MAIFKDAIFKGGYFIYQSYSHFLQNLTIRIVKHGILIGPFCKHLNETKIEIQIIVFFLSKLGDIGPGRKFRK